jgi:hypothetical protein
LLIEVNRDICGLTSEARSEHIKSSGNLKRIPLVAEFSFDYDATKKDEGELESYSPNVVEGTSGFFRSVLNQAGWLDLATTTKTAFALEVL